ncbi:hypothetical protein ACFYSC_25545 [Streptosporangium sp. NPDC004379]|uniref:hypothetical protein n=1 Tax=Streptosporangium sp. NPDC004379 TaxID=3366189 RepID=UPI00368E645F
MSPDAVKQSVARPFTTEGAELTEAAVAEANELYAVGNFWGDDQAGRIFYHGDSGSPGYRDMAEGVMGEAHALGGLCVRIGDRIFTMGTNVEAAEWEAISHVPRMPW